MSPVKNPALPVPLILSSHLDLVALASRHAGGKIDIVAHQDRVARIEAEDEALMTRAFVVVPQKLLHSPLDLYDEAGTVLSEALQDCSLSAAGGRVRNL